MLLFSIQSKLRACNRRLYVPRDGCGIWDIDKVRTRCGERQGCSVELLTGAIHMVDIVDWTFILTVFQL